MKRIRLKHVPPARVCLYILEEKRLTGRALARLLRVHHRTVQRYVAGLHFPEGHIRERMARLMGEANWAALRDKAMATISRYRNVGRLPGSTAMRRLVGELRSKKAAAHKKTMARKKRREKRLMPRAWITISGLHGPGMRPVGR